MNFEFLNIYYSKKIFLVFVMGIASGIPLYMILSTLFIWLTRENIDISTVGLFALTQIPWSLNKNIQDYSRGTCPVAEKLEQNYFVDICMETEYDDQDCEILENICINTIGSA